MRSGDLQTGDSTLLLGTYLDTHEVNPYKTMGVNTRK